MQGIYLKRIISIIMIFTMCISFSSVLTFAESGETNAAENVDAYTNDILSVNPQSKTENFDLSGGSSSVSAGMSVEVSQPVVEEEQPQIIMVPAEPSEPANNSVNNQEIAAVPEKAENTSEDQTIQTQDSAEAAPEPVSNEPFDETTPNPLNAYVALHNGSESVEYINMDDSEDAEQQDMMSRGNNALMETAALYEKYAQGNYNPTLNDPSNLEDADLMQSFSSVALEEVKDMSYQSNAANSGEPNNKYSQWYYNYLIENNITDNPYAPNIVMDKLFVYWCADQLGYLRHGFFPEVTELTNLHDKLIEYSNKSFKLNDPYLTVQQNDLMFEPGIADTYIVSVITKVDEHTVQYVTCNAYGSVDQYMCDISEIPASTRFIRMAGVPNRYLLAAANWMEKNIGLTSAAVAGILANMHYESKFSPNALGDAGTSYGLCQWHEERWDGLVEYCDTHGLNWQTPMGQLEWLKYELQHVAKYIDLIDIMNSCEDSAVGAYQSAYFFCTKFEKPKDAELKADARGMYAFETAYPMLFSQKKLAQMVIDEEERRDAEMRDMEMRAMAEQEMLAEEERVAEEEQRAAEIAAAAEKFEAEQRAQDEKTAKETAALIKAQINQDTETIKQITERREKAAKQAEEAEQRAEEKAELELRRMEEKAEHERQKAEEKAEKAKQKEEAAAEKARLEKEEQLREEATASVIAHIDSLGHNIDETADNAENIETDESSNSTAG